MATPRDKYPQIARTLEGITRRAIEAVNNRQWDSTADPWIHFAEDHIYDLQWRNDLISAMREQKRCRPELEPLEPTGHQFVDFEKTIAHVAPEFHVCIANVEMTVVDPDAAHATVMVEAEETGVPPGVTRPCMVALDFSKRDGNWLCTMLRSVAGIDSTS
ncbi:hypothetical protein M409DRAFT_22427 [Zasmidium cellare ATCC 36951]|uniref:SnoaL-like domain-containing protein n=1 Tax=Zasmidium cellare ATCC 36951 TaxID=1080233 RepID=A0A6A6CQ84_ZASCE|nr:uncharacterized protein M409DRAFT_22427 [Zasmidium cellare ATCC 36951]KAF2167626.1 hypothetical protein M409DRAFT_22427 [Zasmidium cellare ATCC 36951]